MPDENQSQVVSTAPRLPFTFLRGREVDDARGLRKFQRYLDIRAGTFPPPLKVGKTSLWPSHEVEAILRAQLRGDDDQALRKLVQHLVALRQGA